MPTVCASCNAENRSTARFCYQCGARLAVETAPSSQIVPSQVSEAAAPAPETAEMLQDFSAVQTGGSADLTRDGLETVGVLQGAGEATPVGDALLDGNAAPFDPEDHQPPIDNVGASENPPDDWGGGSNAATEQSDDGLVATVPAALETDTNDDTAPAIDLPDQPVETEVMPIPLVEACAVGEFISDRYRVTAVTLADDGSNVYTAEDHGVCPACGVAVQVSEDEPYCFECGAYLLDMTASRPVCILHLLPDGVSVDNGAATLIWNGHTFRVDSLSEGESVSADGGPTEPAFTRGVQLLTGQRSHVGILRAASADEDSVFALTLTSIYDSIARPTVGLYFVADGMGGHGDGEVASRLVAEIVSSTLLQSIVLPLFLGQEMSTDTIGVLIDAAVQDANTRLIDAAQSRGNDMGTTLTLALVVDEQAYVANVGDSRTYFWRKGELRQITEDHSAVFQLYRKGILTEQEIYTHPRRNEITRSMGLRGDIQVDYFRETLAPGDALLLCCDGLWEMLHNDGILDVLLTDYGNPQAVCDELIKRANQAGGEDNISVVLVHALG